MNETTRGSATVGGIPNDVDAAITRYGDAVFGGTKAERKAARENLSLSIAYALHAARHGALEKAADICDGRAYGWTAKEQKHRDTLLLQAAERIRSLMAREGQP